ncbi:MAG TPA: signal peptidase II [Fimbriimonadaceae bacterium]|jgi:signal peptidase II
MNSEAPSEKLPVATKRLDWRLVFWFLFVVLILADQIIKLWARGHFNGEGQAMTVIPNVFDLTLTYNKGIAFGMFQGFGGLLAPVAVAIAAGAIYYSMKNRKESPWVHTAMALLAAGALGNLYDRVVNGKVTDMFHFRAFEFPVFNLADSCITVAAVILILRWSWEWFQESRKKEDASPWSRPAEPVLKEDDTNPV